MWWDGEDGGGDGDWSVDGNKRVGILRTIYFTVERNGIWD